MNIDLKRIAKQMSNFEKNISFSINSEKELLLIIDILRYDFVTNFHVGNITYSIDCQNHIAYLKVEYLYSISEYEEIIKKVLNKLSEIKKEIVKIDSDIEKEFFVHDWICRNVKYLENGRDSHCVIGPLLYGEGVCEGISKTAQALFKIANLKSHVICGKALHDNNTEVLHSRNSVFINGKWHLLDITYDNTISDKIIRYDFFNISPNLIKKTHKPFDNYLSFFNECVIGDSYFEINNLKFNLDNELKRHINKEIRNKKTVLYFQIDFEIDNNIVNEIKNYILSFHNIKTISFAVNESNNIFYFCIIYKRTLFNLF